MKIFGFKIRNKNKFLTVVSNLVIVCMLLTVFAFSYAGGTLKVFNTNSGLEAIYKGNTEKNYASLMFNVYWGTEYIESILNVFEEKSVTTTFFVGGVWAVKNEALLQLIVDKGHELGNHGYNHKDQNKISQQKNFDEISQTHQLVESLVKVKMNLFAPPSGAFNNTTLAVAHSLGYKTIMWTKDTIDWRDKDADLIYSRAIKNACGGDLILMHPTEKTLEALPQMIDYYLSKNILITTVSKTISD